MTPKLGAVPLDGNRCEFLVWAPRAETVEVRIFGPGHHFSAALSEGGGDCSRSMSLQRIERGYHWGIMEEISRDARYAYGLDGKKVRPDPASRFQPDGVHAASAVMDSHAYQWKDAGWRGLPLDEFIIYEVHVGTYSSRGTFDGVIEHLDEIKDLGITALELMPVAQFPGDRNWGYDGVYPFAVQASYGGPDGLRRLVDACHQRGLAVVLDVVYNHVGPEGNYLGDFGPYFTDRYRSPWGRAINFDGPESDEVVRYFTENALSWLRDFHIDALRLDAIHGIVDCSAQPFLQMLARSVHEFAKQEGRKIYLIAESDLNDVRCLQAAESGGYGLDSQWSDDFHHSLHTLLTGEESGYYLDFGEVSHLGKAIREGFVYSGQYSAHRRQRHGNSSRDAGAHQFVVSAQNHDQIGNRLSGDRLSTLVPFEALKLAAGMVILSPYLPLLFMGEEWGEPAPFQYFTSHSDADLIESVRRGRREEFAAFRWQGEPPDAQSEDSFLRCKLNRSLRTVEPHRTLLEFYKELIRLRKKLPALARVSKEHMEVRSSDVERTLEIFRWARERESVAPTGQTPRRIRCQELFILANFSEEPRDVAVISAGAWNKVLDSADGVWNGPGSSLPSHLDLTGQTSLNLRPKSFSVFSRSE